MKSAGLSLVAAALMLAAPSGRAGEVIRLANHPALSPDGKTLVFDWDGDIWSVASAGGAARRLTNHPARDRQPRFSPDGKQLAFISERSGSPQVHVMPASGGTPRQLTYHTAGCFLQDWCPDGRQLLVNAVRDHFWRHAERFFTISAETRQAERLLFDDYGQNGSLSPDSKRLLFTREGPAWWRKGYHGSQASQIWLYDLESKQFRQILAEDSGCRWPLWKPDGKGFYYVSARSGSFNLWERDLSSNNGKQRTHFDDDGVVFPCLSRDGSTLVFRHLFDLYCYHPGKDESPRKIDIRYDSDANKNRIERRVLREASEVAFTADGLEIAFIAGGDLWLMDTELREPRQVTATAEEEKHPECHCLKAQVAQDQYSMSKYMRFSQSGRYIPGLDILKVALKNKPFQKRLVRPYKRTCSNWQAINPCHTEDCDLRQWHSRYPVFSPDGRTLLFVADREARSDIYRAVPSKHTDTNRHWWQHGPLTLSRLTDDGEVKSKDVGVLRVPFRGWFLLDNGEDMELNGAVPDHVLWPKPGQMPRGEDVQLSRAIDVLQAEVKAWKQWPRPPLRKATERVQTQPANE